MLNLSKNIFKHIPKCLKKSHFSSNSKCNFLGKRKYSATNSKLMSVSQTIPNLSPIAIPEVAPDMLANEILPCWVKTLPQPISSDIHVSCEIIAYDEWISHDETLGEQHVKSIEQVKKIHIISAEKSDWVKISTIHPNGKKTVLYHGPANISIQQNNLGFFVLIFLLIFIILDDDD